MSLYNSPSKLWTAIVRTLQPSLTFMVFLFFDFLDCIFCVIYRLLDEFFEGHGSTCYCGKGGRGGSGEVSESLYGRRNVFRDMGFGGGAGGCGGIGDGVKQTRWSDCGCEDCVSWMKDGLDKLHVVIKEPSRDVNEVKKEDSVENVIFLHGFLSSSAIWTETAFPNLSEDGTRNYRLFAVDLLGFGRSPKPRECLYTLHDHIGMIEKSTIFPFRLKSFHLVAHSMGCIIALALAAKYPNSVKSITLVAPPYFPSGKEKASLMTLKKLAGKKLWPPLLFGLAFMSWYEHLGRCVCLIICRNHRFWEWILKLITRKRDLQFPLRDLTKHTHHSAWLTMHNVICGAAKSMDKFLERLSKSGAKICVVQGDRDDVVPLECSSNIKEKVLDAEVTVIKNADHSSVIIDRVNDFTQHLEQIWAATS